MCHAKICIGEHIRDVQRIFRPLFNATDASGDGSEFDHLFKDGAGLELDKGRAGEMIGMRVRLQHLADLDAELLRRVENGIGGGRGRLTAAEIVVEHRIDDRADLGRGIPHQIPDRIGRPVEEGPDLGPDSGGYVFAPLFAAAA